MTADIKTALTDEQSAIVHLAMRPGAAIDVRACPGAGKPRVIVARHLEAPVPPRQGRAVISFTRVAQREIRERCLREGRADLLEPPHYVGTLDTFLWRHLIRPYLSELPEKRVYNRLESWKGLPEARKDGVVLDDFDFGFDRSRRLHVGAARLKEDVARRRRIFDGKRRRLEEWARDTILRLSEAGYLTGELVRDKALSHLEDAEIGPRLRSMLTGRFAELIVDEAQDCSHEDRAIMYHLNRAGLPIMFVGDPDQHIYGFRNKRSRRPELPEFDFDEQHTLTRNWRSTQTVCDLAATFRVSTHAADTAVADHADNGPPVMLIPQGDGTDVVRVFQDEAAKLGIDVGATMTLAYGGSDLPTRSVGDRRPPHDRRLGRLLWAVATLRTPDSPARRRTDAATMFREFILEGWGVPGAGTERERLLRQDRDPVELQRVANRILCELPEIADQPTRKWKAEALKVLADHALLLETPGPEWDCPRGSADQPAYRSAGFPAPALGSRTEGRVDIIHQVKGQEAEAVLVMMPVKAVRTWLAIGRGGLSPDEQETLRVHFVGVTRARRLVGLAVPAECIREIRQFLAHARVRSRTVFGAAQGGLAGKGTLFDQEVDGV